MEPEFGVSDAYGCGKMAGMNPIRDKHGVVIKEGDYIRYFDSTRMWLDGKVIDIGSCLAVETEENPIALYTWPGQYVYDGHPVEELEIFSRNIKVRDDGTLTVINPEIQTKYRIEDAGAIERMEVPEEFKAQYTEAHGSIHTWVRRWPCYSHLEPYLNPESALCCEVCGAKR